MPENDMLFREAIAQAMREEMKRDATVFLMGEDVGPSGGIFKCCEGLFDEFGPQRVLDTPIAEAGYIGLSVGAAMTGMRPIAELMFGDFALLAMDQIVNQAAKIRYMTGGQCKVPLTIRLSMGAGRSSAAQHSQSLQAIFAHIPGLKVVLPSTPRDAKGLLKSAIRDDNPVLFFEHKFLYRSLSGLVPEEAYRIPIGEARTVSTGQDITIITYGLGVLWAEKVIAQHPEWSIELIDLRTLLPWDEDTVMESVSRTSRALVLHEDTMTGGVGAEISARIHECCWKDLDAPVVRVAGLDTAFPFAENLEEQFLANHRLETALVDLMAS